MNRRIFWRLLLLGSILLVAPALAQDGKLIDAAKKEGGKVIIYSSMESSISDGIAAAFKKKTGLEMEYWRLLHTRHLIRKGEASSQVAELWRTAAQAEELGFSHVWVGDSPRLSLLDRAHADCLTVMAALAAKTQWPPV